MFEWTPGILIVGDMTESEDKYLNEENAEVEFIKDIVDEAVEEENIDNHPNEGFLVSDKYDCNDPKSDTDKD